MNIHLVEVWNIPGMPLRYGLTISMAMVLGYFLYDRRHNWKWIISWIAFALLHSWIVLTMCTELFETCTPPWHTPAFSLILMSAASFAIGTFSGMILAFRSEKQRERDIKAMKVCYREIRKSNGLIIKE